MSIRSVRGGDAERRRDLRPRRMARLRGGAVRIFPSCLPICLVVPVYVDEVLHEGKWACGVRFLQLDRRGIDR